MRDRPPCRAVAAVAHLALALCLALALGVSWPVAAQAPSDDSELYTVRDIEVDATAKDATAARERAIADGQRTAFAKLKERLVPPAELGRVPDIDPAAVADLVRDFEVQEERTSAVRYLGKLTYRFRPNAVKSLFRGAGIAAIEEAAPTTLLLPVLRTGGAARLWSEPEPNPWLDAWNAHGQGDALVPVALPLGDLADVSRLDASKAVAGDVGAITELMARYNAGAAVVAVAEGPVAADRPLTISLNRFFPGMAGESLVVTAPPAATPEAALQGAVAAAMAELERMARQESGQGAGGEASLSLTVPFAAPQEWLDIRKRLGQVSPVTAVELKSLARDRARVDLRHRGSEMRLRAALLQRGLLLMPPTDAAGLPELRLGASAAPADATAVQ